MQTQPNVAQPREVPGISSFIQQTTRKVKAIGAGLRVFLRAIKKISFSAEPVHVPDQALIDEVVAILLSGEKTVNHD